VKVTGLNPLLVVSLLCLLLHGGCGKKDDPTAPVAVAPGKVRNFEARPAGRAITLSFAIPENNTDGSILTDLAGFAVLRSEQAFAKECRDCPKRFSVIDDIDYKTYMLNNPQARALEYSDGALTFQTVYTYRVVSYNTDKRPGTPVTSPDIFWDVPSAPPREIRPELQGKSVVLSWEAPTTLQDGAAFEDPLAYNLYRRTPETPYTLAPINIEPIATLSCRDRGIMKDSDYVYTLRAIRQVRETAVESEASAEVAINTIDHTPPRAPTGLVAVPTTTGMVLKWDENEEEDLAGYNLYRRTAGDARPVKLNDAPIARGGYNDATVVKNSTYTYTVTALDDATVQNESAPSEGITITGTF
jgi:hypothetical protein